MSYFFVKLRCSLFDIKLWKYLLVDVGRRYSIYVLYIVFLLQDFFEEFKFCINFGVELYIELCGEGSLMKGGDNFVEVRNI